MTSVAGPVARPFCAGKTLGAFQTTPNPRSFGFPHRVQLWAAAGLCRSANP